MVLAVHGHRVAPGALLAVLLVVLFVVLMSGLARAAPLSPGEHSSQVQENGFIAFLGRLHPAAVHFPIALVIIAGVAEVLALRTGSKKFEFVARFNLCSAALIATPAAVLGFAAAADAVFSGPKAAAFSVHRIAGITVPVLAVLTVGLAASAARTQQPAQRMMYRVLLLMTVACVILAAYFGGILTFGPEHFE